jgi:hypothetical protein
MNVDVKYIIDLIKRDKLDIIKRYVADGFDVTTKNNAVVKFAAIYGRFEIFKYFILNENVDISDGDLIQTYLSFGLQYDYYNQTNSFIIKLIKNKRIKPSANESVIFNWAITHNKVDLTNLCLKDPDVDANVYSGSSLYTILKRNNYQVLNILIKHNKINFDAFNGDLLLTAVNENSTECVRILSDIPEVKNYNYYASLIRDMLRTTIVDNYNYYIIISLLSIINNDSFYISLALKLAIAHKRFDLIQHIVRYRKVDYTHTDIFFDYAANVNGDKIKQEIFKELVYHKEFLKHLSLNIIKSYKCIVEAYSNFMNITPDEFLLLIKI